MSVRLAMILGVVGVSLVGCSPIDRSMLFFTHTTIGIEVSTGDPTSAPVKALVGYNRTEGVINPVYDKDGIATTDGSKYRKEAYSVLATIQGQGSANAPATATGTEGNVGTKIAGSQWFATGEAAKILASQPGIAGAISGSPDIAEAEAKIRGIAQGIPTSHQPIAIAAMKLAYTQLTASAAEGDTEARNLKQRLDGTAFSLSGEMPFTQYQYDRATKKVDSVSPQPTYSDMVNRFNNVHLHWSKLNASIVHLTEFVTSWKAEPEKKQPKDYAEKQKIRDSQIRDRESFLKDWGNRKEGRAAARMVHRLPERRKVIDAVRQR